MNRRLGRMALVAGLFLLASGTGSAQSSPSVSVTGQVGYRYVARNGLDHLAMSGARFDGVLNGRLTLQLGRTNAGLYGAALGDVYLPNGEGEVTRATEGRIGYFHQVQHYDSGLRTTTHDTSRCWYALGVCRVSGWSETSRVAPPRWWHTTEYFWAGYRRVAGLPPRGTSDVTAANAIVVGAGVTTPGRVMARGNFEVDVHRYLRLPSDRNPWALRLRGAMDIGPVYVDAVWLWDDVVGGELSVGGGIILRTR